MFGVWQISLAVVSDMLAAQDGESLVLSVFNDFKAAPGIETAVSTWMVWMRCVQWPCEMSCWVYDEVKKRKVEWGGETGSGGHAAKSTLSIRKLAPRFATI